MIDPTERVAIVGLGGVFAGSPDPSRFWENVARGVDATTEVPPGRWAVEPPEAFDPAVAAPDRVYATRGGFVEGFAFDPEGLDLDPDLARRLDPSFQLALHAGRAAWRDAATSGLDRSRVGVVFGQIVLPTESASALARETLGRRSGAGPLTEPLNRHAAGLPAGVLARALGLGGGAFTLDAACASSLYALRLAADDLLAGRADAVLTGGVSRPDPLYTQMGFSQLRALSPEGKARPFDSRAGGLVVGEGAGMFVLKRLGDALRDGDHVYALVAAVGLSNDVDGGLLAPSREGQLRALTSAYDRAGWDPKTVDLIECHATGTPLGDAVEFGSLRALWGDAGLSPGGCVIGSHKANVGHALTAAGAAGLLKVVMALRHDTLPPTPNFSAPADGLDYDGGPFRVLTEARPWPRPADGRPRRAAVSGFGFGGINAHALIEEWVPGSPTSPTAAAWVDPEREAEPEAVAIVGLSAHVGPFAGLRAFQERVLGGGDRVRATGYHLDSIELPVDRFRIPPKELAEMLPQQSLLLNAAADAIADAGWGGLDRPRTRAGVVVGITLDPNTTNYHVRWTADDVGDRDAAGPPLSANRTMGALGGLVASRVAREFRLGGPSFTVSSEETSGLRAVDVAARLLRLGEIDEAVVGAVDLTGDPRVVAAARRAGLPGLARSDAAAALVLKRLVDAERDGDRVYAVVRGLGSASGGRSTRPSPTRPSSTPRPASRPTRPGPTRRPSGPSRARARSDSPPRRAPPGRPTVSRPTRPWGRPRRRSGTRGRRRGCWPWSRRRSASTSRYSSRPARNPGSGSTTGPTGRGGRSSGRRGSTAGRTTSSSKRPRDPRPLACDWSVSSRSGRAGRRCSRSRPTTPPACSAGSTRWNGSTRPSPACRSKPWPAAGSPSGATTRRGGWGWRSSPGVGTTSPRRWPRPGVGSRPAEKGGRVWIARRGSITASRRSDPGRESRSSFRGSATSSRGWGAGSRSSGPRSSGKWGTKPSGSGASSRPGRAGVPTSPPGSKTSAPRSWGRSCSGRPCMTSSERWASGPTR